MSGDTGDFNQIVYSDTRQIYREIIYPDIGDLTAKMSGALLLGQRHSLWGVNGFGSPWRMAKHYSSN